MPATTCSLVAELAELGVTKPVIPGIMPITNIKQIARMATLSGAEVPAWVVEAVEHVDDPAEVRRVGVDIASTLCSELLEAGAPGLHFYTMNRSTATREIWANLGLGVVVGGDQSTVGQHRAARGGARRGLRRAPRSGRPGRSLSSMPYLPGLDGMRALAVVAVMVYHANHEWLPGGFLGVEVFFVISGYLITLLLVGEHERTGRISLRHFWARRARRLLPALFFMLLLLITYTWIWEREELGAPAR